MEPIDKEKLADLIDSMSTDLWDEFRTLLPTQLIKRQLVQMLRNSKEYSENKLENMWELANQLCEEFADEELEKILSEDFSSNE